MAELIGLIASIVGVAGAAASVSLTLFSCASKWKSTLSDLEDIAADVRDLSGVLDYLGEVLEKHGQRLSSAAIKQLTGITKRCETTIKQLKVTAQLVESRFKRWQWLYRKEKATEMRSALDGYKSNISLVITTVLLAKSLDDDVAYEQEASKRRISANAQRNIAKLQSAILTHKSNVKHLKSAEKALDEENVSRPNIQPTSTELMSGPAQSGEFRRLFSKSNPGVEPCKQDFDTVPQVLLEAKKNFESEITAAQGDGVVDPASSETTTAGFQQPSHWREASLMVMSDHVDYTWDRVLLRSYDSLSKAKPASESLTIRLPWLNGDDRELNAANPSSTALDSDSGKTEATSNQDADVSALLQELTTTSAAGLLLYQSKATKDDEPSESVPGWVREEYTLVGENENNPADWRVNPNKPPRPSATGPIIRRAYEEADSDCRPLYDIFTDHGGGYVWRHDDGNERDYYVGSQLVLKYKVKPDENCLDPDQAAVQTILSKQWISKDVLKNAGYAYKDFGEGGYAVPQRLTPAQVVDLHTTASNRTEVLLRRLSKHSKYRTSESRPKPAQLARGAYDFSPESAEQGELPFKKGDVLEVTHRAGTWWAASLHGKHGWVPYNYIELIN